MKKVKQIVGKEKYEMYVQEIMTRFKCIQMQVYDNLRTAASTELLNW